MSKNISWLEERLNGNGDVVIIDGGMGSELEKSGIPMDHKVWSSTAMLSHPESVRQIHESYIDAGAEVIITNTFSSARHMLEPAGLGDDVREVNVQAVKLAREARDNVANHPVAIAGSICEWASTEDPRWHTLEAVSASVREQAQLLAEAGVDIFAIEMCQRADMSCGVIETVLEVGLPLWIGVSAKSYGSDAPLAIFDFEDRDFEDLVSQVTRFPAMMVNVMHTPLPDIKPALEVVRRHWDGPVGVYPESGYFIMPNWQFVDVVEPQTLIAEAQEWLGTGVRMVGGCCGIGPEHIGALRGMQSNRM